MRALQERALFSARVAHKVCDIHRNAALWPHDPQTSEAHDWNQPTVSEILWRVTSSILRRPEFARLGAANVDFGAKECGIVFFEL